MTYSAHYSKTSVHLLEVDRHKNCLQVMLTRNSDGECIAGEFELAEAEEIAASIARVCSEIRKERYK